ncbi:SET and MYND domain-containing protein 3 [Phytophthora pseudosyringae]|uniref:SET and MYND domain-containing protein 3 n=1 Tax=Phytophthora pseudosyringae TaxID=221518 RepID=A0A8T1VT65_9STRA|nr:SET and MYND domain-containing protein 3 [Phytophthora pseudosyringae]
MPPFHEVLDARKGRCAVTSAALRAGSRVLRASAVCAVASSACGWCFTPHAALSRCAGCRVARYCSRTCQQRDWVLHRRECSAWRSVPAANASPSVLLVSRLAAKLFLGSQAHQDEKNGVLKLRHHLDDHAALKRRQFRDMTQLVLLLLTRYTGDKKEQMPSFEALRNELEPEILKLFGRVNCNAFSLANDVTNEAVGIGLFPDGALFNHDCDPNCVVSFRGREMQVHVVKDVQAGQELTVSYVELLQSTHARRTELKASYFFDCECARCHAAAKEEAPDDWFLDGLVCSNKECDGGVVVVEAAADGDVAVCKMCGGARDGQEIAGYERQLKSIEALKVSAEQDKWEMYQRAWEIATRRLRLHPRNARVAVMAREIGNFLLDAASVALQRLALEFCLAELYAVEWLLPKAKLPSRGLLHLQIGKLLYEEVNAPSCALAPVNRAEQIQKAVKHLQEALSMLDCAYGSSSAAVQSAQLMLDEVQRAAHELA